jgi:hypothetical protein
MIPAPSGSHLKCLNIWENILLTLKGVKFYHFSNFSLHANCTFLAKTALCHFPQESLISLHFEILAEAPTTCVVKTDSEKLNLTGT